jgi:hypothetical protein
MQGCPKLGRTSPQDPIAVQYAGANPLKGLGAILGVQMDSLGRNGACTLQLQQGKLPTSAEGAGGPAQVLSRQPVSGSLNCMQLLLLPGPSPTLTASLTDV